MLFTHLEHFLSKGKAHFNQKWDTPILVLWTAFLIILKYFQGRIYFLFFHQHKPNVKGVNDETPTDLTTLASGNLSTLY